MPPSPEPAAPPRRIVFVAFPDLTLLDLVGVYDVLRRLHTMKLDPEVRHRIIGTAEELHDDSGLRFRPDGVYEPLDEHDLLVVPGGYGTRPLMEDQRFLDWLSSWRARPGRPIASVCTGSLLLGRAGFLAGLRATTHHTSFADLAPLCREVVAERVVDEGQVITAGGVSSTIDLGLHLVERFWGSASRRAIARQMELQPAR